MWASVTHFCMRTRRPPPRSSLGPSPYSDPCGDLIWQWPLWWCVQTCSVSLTSISNCWLDLSPWIFQQELQFNMPPVEWFISNCGSFFLSVFLIASSHSCHPESWPHLPPASRVKEVCYQPPLHISVPTAVLVQASAVLFKTLANCPHPSQSLSFMLQREWLFFKGLLRWLFISLKTNSSLLNMTYTTYTGVRSWHPLFYLLYLFLEGTVPLVCQEN